jgi:hypothetical protein
MMEPIRAGGASASAAFASRTAAIRAQLAPIQSVDGLAASLAREAGLARALAAPRSPLRAAYAEHYLALLGGSSRASVARDLAR